MPNAELLEEPVSASLEIPFRPGWPPSREARIEPPLVPVEPLWEYKEVVRQVPTGLLTEAELNALGAERWELAGIIPAGGQVHFYFKRERRI
jgi:hypothetical protein